jgi:3-oxoacyl-[acyl-carrier-protein] synthase II
MTGRRVVITGLSSITPMGMGVKNGYRNMLSGMQGVGVYQPRPTNEQYKGRYGTSLHPDYKEDEYLTTFGPQRIFTLTNALGKNCFIDSFGSIDNLPKDTTRFGTMVSLNMETLANTRNVQRKGENVRSRDNFAACNFYSVFTLHLNYHLKGYSDCTAVSIGDALRHIKHGVSDYMLAGGCDYITNEVGYPMLKKLGIMDYEGDDYKIAPYDKNARGAAPGQGGGFLLLEDMETALQRNAKIYGEIVGYSNITHGKFAANEYGDGDDVCEAILSAVDEAKVSIDDIDFIDTSATSCPQIDREEMNGIRKALKGAKDPMKTKITGFAGYTGFTGLANEGIASVFGLEAMETGVLPKIVNLENPIDEAKGLNLLKENTKGDYKYFVKHSIGAGGYETAIVIKAF